MSDVGRLRRIHRFRKRAVIILSAVLGAVALEAAVRSEWHEDGAGWRRLRDDGRWCEELRLHSSAGRVMFSAERWQITVVEYPAGFFTYTALPYAPGPLRGLLGFHMRTGARFIQVDVPYWFLVALFAFAPVWAAVGVLDARRVTRRGRCLTCGYDLRATPDRCPECGRTVTSTPPSAREGKGETEGV
jgi:hypothetical protein